MVETKKLDVVVVADAKPKKDKTDKEKSSKAKDKEANSVNVKDDKPRKTSKDGSKPRKTSKDGSKERKGSKDGSKERKGSKDGSKERKGSKERSDSKTDKSEKDKKDKKDKKNKSDKESKKSKTDCNIGLPNLDNSEIQKFIEQHFPDDPLFGKVFTVPEDADRVEMAKGSGNFYTGQWNNSGKPDGVGLFEWVNKCTYLGEIKNGAPCGLGVFTAPNGEHIGRFENAKANGYGKFVYTTGLKHIGMFEDAKRHGLGMEITDDYRYVGPFVNGQKEGKGYCEMKGDNGELQIYNGDFNRNDMQGFGFIRFATGKTYEGEMEINRLHGKGKMVFPEGRVYVGDFKDNKLTGTGTMWMIDGRRHEGEFVNGAENGHGVLFYANGNSRAGRWLDGVRVTWEGEEILSDKQEALPELVRPKGYEGVDPAGLNAFIIQGMIITGGLEQLLGEKGIAPILDEAEMKKMSAITKKEVKADKKEKKKAAKAAA